MAARLISPQDFSYAAARAVYRWDVFAYHYGSEFELTEEQFLEAVKSASTYPATDLVESAKPKGI